MRVARDIFDAFGRKRDILHLLDRCLEADGVQLFIGEESGYEPFDYSVVTSPYEVDGQLGVLGVIGPTRMAYERVIPIVDATARLLGAAMQDLPGHAPRLIEIFSRALEPALERPNVRTSRRLRGVCDPDPSGEDR